MGSRSANLVEMSQASAFPTRAQNEVRASTSIPTVFLCQVFPPDPQSTSQLFGALIPRMATAESPFEVWSALPPIPGTSREEAGTGRRIRRLGLVDRGRQGPLRRLAAYASYSLGVARQFLSLPPGTRLVAVTNPPFLPVWVWLLSKLRACDYRLVLLDLYPEGLEQIGWLRPRGLAARLWSLGNRRAYAGARQISVLGRDMKRLLIERYGIPEKKIDWIPHWSAVEASAPPSLAENQILRRLGLGSKWVVQYSGNMGLWHDLDNIVRAAAMLQDEPAIHFLLAGQGIRRAGAERLCRQLGLRNVTWIDPVPLPELDDLLAGCHAALISQKEGLAGIAVPCKLYGILASGRPILAAVPPACETALVVEEEKCGEVIPPHDPSALAECIRRWSRDPGRVAQMGANARAAYENRYTLEHAAKRFQAAWGLSAD